MAGCSTAAAGPSLAILLLLLPLGSAWTICSYDPTFCNGAFTGKGISFTYLDISGTIPTQLGLLSSLRDIRVDNNHLSGTLPAMWAKSTLAQNLRTLIHQNNQISGTLPPEWSGFRSIDRIALSENRLSGTLPAEWGALQSGVVFIETAHNQKLSGTLPTTWADLDRLEELALAKTALSGSLPGSWLSPGMRSLAFLVLDNTFVSGTLPAHLPAPAMPRPSRLSAHCRVQTDVPIPTDPNCRLLSLQATRLSGSLPASLHQTAGFTHVFLGYSFLLSGTVPADAAALTALGLPSTRISGHLPPYHGSPIEGGVRLAQLSLADSHFSGTIPESLLVSKMPLLGLDLSRNRGRISGFLPPTLGQWRTLPTIRSLKLTGNAISGSFPTQLCHGLSRLTEGFDLSSNAISGTLPTEIGLIASEYVPSARRPSGDRSFPLLAIDGNRLSGTLPMQLGLLAPSECRLVISTAGGGGVGNRFACPLPALPHSCASPSVAGGNATSHLCHYPPPSLPPPPPPPSPSEPGSGETAADDDSGMATWAIAVIAAAGGLVLLALGLYVYKYKYGKKAAGADYGTEMAKRGDFPLAIGASTTQHV